MESMKKGFLESARELKKVPVLTVCALLAAVAIVLRMVATISIGPYIRIGFSGLPNQLVDLLFGPVVGAIFGGMLDVIKYLAAPDGPFFPGFTLSAIVAGLIYGMIYYKKKLTLWRVLMATGLVALIVNLSLGTLWLDMLYGKGFFAILPGRVVKNLVMWPIDSMLFYVLAAAIEKTGIFRSFRGKFE